MPHLGKADRRAKVSANEARRRKEVALAEMREIELEKLKGELLPVAQVRDTWARILQQVRDAVLRIPDKLAPQVAAVADAREARVILATECEAILKDVSDVVRRAA